MAPKLDIFLITIEFLLVSFIGLDLYGGLKVFESLEDVVDGGGITANFTGDDPKIVDIGSFAVDEYNKYTRGKLKFQKVVKVLFAQSSYMFLIEVMDGFESKQYAAVVQDRGGQRGLVAFQEYSNRGF
ncbi:cysteine protein inhibitor 5-like [Dorcoceras hygrometricum]|uniref:Cysteine protein inhibitor 5-like n=1 Tax=Dorcoceras hygrometricum TaxID=472368 RepID=A0A2Z7AAX0_9LAMI|nr:cysteine protein inhibitor 5-like [Dorcoceras hygrometricum]